MRIILIYGCMLISIYAVCQDPENILLKDYRPRSIYKVPVTTINKAKYQAIDAHSHDYAKTEQDVKSWISTMDQAGIGKSIILSMATGQKFDSIYHKYSKYGGRFDIWCGIDFTNHQDKGWVERAIKELERCKKLGAKGVGELIDKGMGFGYAGGKEPGIHIDDPRMKQILARCAALKLPVNVHVAEPLWMYEKMDSTNDGLMNAYSWKIDLSRESILNHQQLIQTLSNAVRDNPQTTFIACHFANCEYNLEILGKLFDQYSNLYADIGARFGETTPIPRYMLSFYKRYQDRLLYGTDMGTSLSMYKVTFRILESNDEHFYETDLFNYHWPCNGFGLPDEVLEKVYFKNMNKIISATSK